MPPRAFAIVPFTLILAAVAPAPTTAPTTASASAADPDIQIAVDSRLILVSNNFLDDFRIGWDLAIPNTAAPAAPATAPGVHIVGSPARANLESAASVIDDWTLNMLLQATLADKRTVDVQSERALIPTGRASTLNTGGRVRKVQSAEALGPVGAGGAQLSPTTQPATPPADAPPNIAINLTPTISADGHHVVFAIDSIRVGSAEAAHPDPQHAGKPVEISIPDGGTLLVGIVKIASGADPKNERTALLLIRPKIITHEEIVNDLFGTGYDKPTGLPTTAPSPSQPAAPSTPPAISPTTVPAAAPPTQRDPDAADRATAAKLEENLKEIISQGQSLEKVLNYLSDAAGTKFDINWPALTAAGIERTTPVNISLRDTPVRKVLTTILSQSGGDNHVLAYTIEDGIVLISTHEDLQSEKHQADRTFDVRDMIPPPSFKQSKQLAEALVETVKAVVSPETWKDAGGAIGTIRVADGMLVVHQTRENLRAVDNLIEQLREARGIQIAVESRLLLVSPNFLDDFRIGWDLSVPGSKDAPPSPAPNSATQPAATQTAASFGASIVDAWTLNMLLQAAMADKRTEAITPPRTTINNDYSEPIAINRPPETAAPLTGPLATTTTQRASPAVFSMVLTTMASVDRRYIVVALGNPAVNHDPPAVTTTAPADHEPNTMVSIPDGGTLLMNLGKIRTGPDPEDERIGLLLMRPNIVLHRQPKNDLFGPNYDRPTALPTTAPTTVPDDPSPRQRAVLLYRAAKERYDTGQYPAAQQIVQQALALDPTNVDVLLLQRILDDKLAAPPVTAPATAQSAPAITLVPHGGLLVSDPNAWLPLIPKDDRTAEQRNQSTHDKLAGQLREIVTDNLGIQRVLNFLSKDTDATLYIDWPALSTAGIDRNTPVSISARDLPFNLVLHTLLNSLGTSNHATFGYMIEDGIVIISLAAPAAPSTNPAAAPSTDPATSPTTAPAAANDATKQKVAQLIADARKLYDAQQFTEAQELLKQAHTLDPDDVTAALFLRIVSTKIMDLQYEAAKHPTTAPTTQSINPLIPYADLMTTGDLGPWPELQRKPDPDAIARADKTARDRLAEVLPDVTVDRQPLEKVLAYLRDDSGSNIFINWPALAGAGIDRNTPVTLALKNVTLPQTLDTIFSQLAETHHAKLTWILDEGIITIAAGPPATSTAPATSQAAIPTQKPPASPDPAAAERTLRKQHLADALANARALGPDDAESPLAREVLRQQPTPQLATQEAAEAARKALDAPIRDLAINDQPLERVFNTLRDAAGANTFINWTSLSAAGIDKNTPVTLPFKNTTYREALNTLFSQFADTYRAKLTWTVDEGIIAITAAPAATQPTTKP